MTRYYLFNWYENKSGRFGVPLTRTSKITLQAPTGKVEFDAQRAVGIFIKNFGSLKQNTICWIKEFDENGQIGEDIVPTEDAIIPVGR